MSRREQRDAGRPGRQAHPCASRPRQHGQRIRDLRAAAGLSQETLAFEAGVAPKTVSRAENGASVSDTSLDRIARALGVLPGKLYDPAAVVGYFGLRASAAGEDIATGDGTSLPGVPTGFVVQVAGCVLNGTIESVKRMSAGSSGPEKL